MSRPGALQTYCYPLTCQVTGYPSLANFQSTQAELQQYGVTFSCIRIFESRIASMKLTQFWVDESVYNQHTIIILFIIPDYGVTVITTFRP